MAFLVAGLGNPGPKYAGNRHNIGFMVVDELARRASESFREKFKGELARGWVSGRGGRRDLWLLKPQTYMNRSGSSVSAAANFYKIAMDEVIVVHDELDIESGEVRVKLGGGHGGHNGLRSIFEHLGKDFVRVRCGIGRPIRGGDVTGWVLGDFSADERITLDDFISKAADAVELVCKEGPRAAMNAVNGRATEQRGNKTRESSGASPAKSELSPDSSSE